MTRIQVSPARRDNTRALVLLRNWASRNVTRVTSSKNSDLLIEKNYARQLSARDKIFSQHLPFSWLRFVIGIISLALVFSDIPRSGTGISNLAGIYPSLQPEEMLAFGTSWNYSVFASTKADADSGLKTARVWSYKYDSTSIVWRVFGEFLAVPDFPKCFFYTNQCPNKTFSSDVAFKMLDSMVNSVAQVGNGRQTASKGPVTLMLRSENEFIDRFHQFLLPKWFTSINWRISQALYYPPEVLAKTNVQSICFPRKTYNIQTPRFCQELWVNFQRSTAPSDLKRKSVGLLYQHTLQRLERARDRFPNLTVDLTFLESQEDLQISRGGLSAVGYRRSDVSTVIRARDCHSGACETLYVSDYRYEAGFLVTDVLEWYHVIATLRIVGQSYFILRGVGLLLSCYYVRSVPKSLSKWTQIKKAWLLFMRVPKQCVVYGSPFPVLCYVLAHLLDASFMYEVFKSRYSTQDGILSIEFQSFMSYAVVQMRTVWIYALIWQIVVTVATSRWSPRNNGMSNGVVGVPSFFLSTLSSVTLAAQYRSTSFRSSKISRIMEFPSNVGRAWEAVRYQYSFAHRGRGNLSFGGVLIDLKFLVCFVLIFTAAWIVRRIFLHFWNRNFKQEAVKLQRSHWFFLMPTPVSYSAGVLWPAASVCIYWLRSFICIRPMKRGLDISWTRTNKSQRWTRFDGAVVPFHASSLTERLTIRRESHRDSLRFIQHQIQCVHRRSDDVEATVAFMNTVLLSDPLVYLRIIVGTSPSTELAYYQSRWRPLRLVLLPIVVVGERNEYTSGLKLLRRVNASELTWSELVQCG